MICIGGDLQVEAGGGWQLAVCLRDGVEVVDKSQRPKREYSKRQSAGGPQNCSLRVQVVDVGHVVGLDRKFWLILSNFII